jgi:DNA helicase HerA-like ATPase
MAIVHIGVNKADPKQKVRWDTSSLVNGHWILIGGSGCGKTHRIRDISRQLQSQNFRIRIMDPHGDILTDPQFTSSVEFSEISPYGINPLEINPSPVYGGVRKRINSLVRVINKYSEKLSTREEAVLRYTLRELYAAQGFYHDKPESWIRESKHMPTLQDLHSFIYRKLEDFVFGHMSEVCDLFSRLNDGLHDIRRLRKYASPAKAEGATDEGLLARQGALKIGTLKQELKAVFGRCVDTVAPEDFSHYIHYESTDVLKAIYDRVEKMLQLGVFKSTPPPFDPGKPIWHYDISSLYVEEQGYLVELTLEDLFSELIQRGFRDEVDTLVFIDEAQKFLSSDDEDHIISVIFREMRKFGGGMALATQNALTFPTDIIVNSGTKVVLGVDEGYQKILSEKLGTERVRFIQPRKSALVQIKSKETSAGSQFVDTLFSRPGEEPG